MATAMTMYVDGRLNHSEYAHSLPCGDDDDGGSDIGVVAVIVAVVVVVVEIMVAAVGRRS